jgi:hypothetical protein
MNNIKWSDAVKAYGKGRVKKGTEDYKECKKLFEKMKSETSLNVDEKKEEVKEEKKEDVKEEKKRRLKPKELLKLIKK